MILVSKKAIIDVGSFEFALSFSKDSMRIQPFFLLRQ